MGRRTCPHCGAPVDSGAKVCPNCRIAIIRKSRGLHYLVIGCIILVAIAGGFVFLYRPALPSAPRLVPQPALTVAAAEIPAAIPAMVEAPGPSPPCTIALSGTKIPPDTIQLRVMSSTCFAGDITGLRVLINGEDVGTLDPGPGSDGTFTGSSGTNNIVVTAKFANGAESVVYQNAGL